MQLNKFFCPHKQNFALFFHLDIIQGAQALLVHIFKFIYAVSAESAIAAAQINTPNAILFTKSARL